MAYISAFSHNNLLREVTLWLCTWRHPATFMVDWGFESPNSVWHSDHYITHWFSPWPVRCICSGEAFPLVVDAVLKGCSLIQATSLDTHMDKLFCTITWSRSVTLKCINIYRQLTTIACENKIICLWSEANLLPTQCHDFQNFVHFFLF